VGLWHAEHGGVELRFEISNLKFQVIADLGFKI